MGSAVGVPSLVNDDSGIFKSWFVEVVPMLYLATGLAPSLRVTFELDNRSPQQLRRLRTLTFVIAYLDPKSTPHHAPSKFEDVM